MFQYCPVEIINPCLTKYVPKTGTWIGGFWTQNDLMELYICVYSTSLMPGVDFIIGLSASIGEFPGVWASFAMRMSDGPVDFWEIHDVLNGKSSEFPQETLN